MKRWSPTSRWSDEGWRSEAWSVARRLPVTLLLGICPGLTVWQLLHLPELGRLAENELASRGSALVAAAISAAVCLAACAAVHQRTARATGRAFGELLRRANGYGAIAAVFPIFLYLRTYTIGEEHPFFSMAACLGIGAIATCFFYRLPLTGRLLAPAPDGERRLAPLLVVLALAAAYALAIARFEWIHHKNLGTRAWDFGLYINTMWQSIHGNPLGCSLLGAGTHAYRHFDPILILISPILLIHRGAESLIAFQAIWGASGAIPLYLLARHQTRSPWCGVALAAMYLLHPALHGPNIYDFHSLFLAGPLILWCMYLLETGRTKRFFAALVLLMLCREEMPVLACLMGIYALISGKPRRVGLGAVAAALVYGLAIYAAVVSRGASYESYFDDIKAPHQSVASSVVLSLLTNPLYVLRYALREEKIVYILKLLVPLLFLPALAGKKRLLFLLGLGVTLIGSKGCFFSISMQYSTWWLPFMLASIPTALENAAGSRVSRHLGLAPRPLANALLLGALASTIAMSSVYGIFWPNSSFRAGYEAFTRVPTAEMAARYQTVRKIEAMIPADASVVTTKHLCPHFAARDEIWIIDTPKLWDRAPDYFVIWPREMEDRHTHKYERRIQKDNVSVLSDPRAYERVLQENDISLYRHK
jgi:uncharacterized membrane protein